MNKLERWFQDEGENFERLVFLEDALLFGRFWAYVWYRLKYLFLRSFLYTAVHLVEFYFLSTLLSDRSVSALFLVISATFVLSGAYWGALEPFRGRVRELHFERATLELRQYIYSALSFARKSCLVTLIAAFLVTGCLAALGILGAPHEIAILLLFLSRLVVELYVRTFHSAVYAVRRVYRPTLAIFGVDLITLLGVAVLYPPLGVWSLVVVGFIGLIARAWLTLFFSKETMMLLGWLPLPAAKERFTLSSKELLAGLSYAVLQLDGLAVILAGAVLHTRVEPSLIVIFFLLSPLLRLSHDWAQLFYFDFKRLETELVENLRTRFESLIKQLAIAISLVTYLGSLLSIAIFFPASLTEYALPLLPFFFVRSLLAFEQLRAFTRYRYLEILLSGAALALGFVAFAHMELSVLALFIALSILFLASAFIAKSSVFQRLIRSPRVTLPTEVLASLHSAPRTARLTIAQVEPRNLNLSLQALLKRVLKQVAADTVVCQFLSHYVLILEPSTTQTDSLNALLLRELGAAFRGSESFSFANGTIESQLVRSRFGRQLRDNLATIKSAPENYLEDILSTYEQTEIIEVETGVLPKPASERQAPHLEQVLPRAGSAARTRLSRKTAERAEVASLSSSESLLVILFLPPRHGHSAEEIRDWSLRIALWNIKLNAPNLHNALFEHA